MKTLCNNKSPIGVIGPVFHTILVGDEIDTFFSDFTGSLIKSFHEKVDKKVKGYNLVQARVVSIPNSINKNDKSELVLFYKRDQTIHLEIPYLNFKQNYEYIVFHMTRNDIMVYGTNIKKFVDEFPVEASPFFTVPYSYNDWRVGGTAYYLTQPDPDIPRHEFILNKHKTVPYFNNKTSVEIKLFPK